MVECTALEMRHRCKPIGGSNPLPLRQFLNVRPAHQKSRFYRARQRARGANAASAQRERVISDSCWNKSCFDLLES